MAVGTVKRFDATKGFGFVAPSEGGKDVFVHITAVRAAGLDSLGEGQTISYEMETDRRGKMAVAQIEVI